jgi:hypothetical protein
LRPRRKSASNRAPADAHRRSQPDEVGGRQVLGLAVRRIADVRQQHDDGFDLSRARRIGSCEQRTHHGASNRGEFHLFKKHV